jgi:NADPH-dependent 2,4-dienoyl-CoA reductase/sulfur reductase-like enzyme
MNLLRKHRVPIHYSTIPLEAKGDDCLKEVTFVRVDNQWSPIPGSEKTMPVDLLCLNFGFIPSTQFSHMAGCQHICDPQIRGWIPKIDSRYQTSVEGIYVAGDCVGIGGVKKAVLEGELVGNEVARHLGLLSDAEADKHLSVLQKKIQGHSWYQRFLKNIYSFRPGLLELLTDRTIICRCEEVLFGDISRFVENRLCNLEEMKLQSRAGMGRCQGRFCYPTLLGILSKSLSKNELCSQDFTARIPVKPFPLESLFDLTSSDRIE